MDKQMRAALIYRGNDLFDKYMDTIRRTLEEEVGPELVLEKVFPCGTSKDDIKRWLKEDEVNLPNYHMILIDDTCRYACGDLNLRTGRKIELDTLFNLVFSGMVRDDPRFSGAREYQREIDIHKDVAKGYVYSEEEKRLLEEFDGNKEEVQKRYKSITENHQEDMYHHISDILQKVKVKPRSILIVTQKLRQHAPLDRADEDEEAGRLLKECFLRAGVPIVSSVDYTDQLYKLSPHDPSETTLHWIIHDRHLQLSVYERDAQKLLQKNVTFLRVPLPNFIEDLAVRGLLDFSEEDVRRNLEHRVREAL